MVVPTDRIAADEAGAARRASLDPLRFCVFTTVALLGWVVGPGPTILLTSALGLWAYLRAWRRGLRETKCALRDVRLALLYLALAFAAGAALTVRALALHL